MTDEAGFTPGVVVKVHMNRVCDHDDTSEADTIATEGSCLFWDECAPTRKPTLSPTKKPSKKI